MTPLHFVFVIYCGTTYYLKLDKTLNTHLGSRKTSTYLALLGNR